MGFTGTAIPNGDFETGDLTDWTTFVRNGTPTAPTVTNVNPHAGTYSALLGSVSPSANDGFGGIKQTIHSVPAGAILGIWFYYHSEVRVGVNTATAEAGAWLETTGGDFLRDFLNVGGDLMVGGVPPLQDVWFLWTADISAYVGTDIVLKVACGETQAFAGYLRVDDVQLGSYTVPGNNDFANATVLGGTSGQLTGQSNILATTEAGEPGPSSFPGGDSPTGTNTIWYKWTAPATGWVEMSTLGSAEGTDPSDELDTVIDVWTGASVSTLTLAAASDEAYSNSGEDTVVIDPWAERGSSNSYVRFAVVSGTTYYLRVYGWNNFQKSDQIVVNWATTAAPPTGPPSNNAFANAITISLPGTHVIEGTTVGSTQEVGEPNPFNGGAGTVWYKIDQPIALAPIYFDFVEDLQIYPYQGTSLGTLVNLDEIYPGDWTSTRPGNTHYFPTSGDPIYLQVAMDTTGLDSTFQFRISQQVLGTDWVVPAASADSVLPPSFNTGPTADGLGGGNPLFWLRTNRFILRGQRYDHTASGYVHTLHLFDQVGTELSSLIVTGATSNMSTVDACRLDGHTVLVTVFDGTAAPARLRAYVVTVADGGTMTLGALSGPLDASTGSIGVYSGVPDFAELLVPLSATRALVPWQDAGSGFGPPQPHVTLLSISAGVVSILDDATAGPAVYGGNLLSRIDDHTVAMVGGAVYDPMDPFVDDAYVYTLVSVAADVLTVSSVRSYGGSLSPTGTPFTPQIVFQGDAPLAHAITTDSVTLDANFNVYALDRAAGTAGAPATVLPFLNDYIHTNYVGVPADNGQVVDIGGMVAIMNPIDPASGFLFASAYTIFQEPDIQEADNPKLSYVWPFSISGTTVTVGTPTALGIPTTGLVLASAADDASDGIFGAAVDPGTLKGLVVIEREIQNVTVAPGDTSPSFGFPQAVGLVPFEFPLPPWFGTAAGTRTRSGTATGAVLSPPPLPPPPTPLAPPARWTLLDLATFEIGTFVLNPTSGGERIYTHDVAYAQFAGLGPVAILTQDPLATGRFAGYILDEADWDFFQSWFNRDGELLLTDDLGRRHTIIFTELSPARKRKATSQWFHDFTASFQILSTEDL